MKTRKILAILCCTMLAMSLTGCFPFRMLQNIMGGSDGPTSVIVESEEPESESESEYEFDFDDFSEEEELSEPDYSDLANDLANADAWYDLDDEDAMWLFTQNQAVLYDDAENYYIASFSKYYNEDAIDYVCAELSEYGLTEDEQLEATSDLAEGEDYFCLVFSDIEVYEYGEYVGPYEEDIIAYIGFEYLDGDTYYHDIIRMDNQEMIYFYSYSDSSSDTGYEDTQRIGSVENGYTDIPADYVKFEDPSLGSDFMQYSDTTGTNIVTLGHYSDELSAHSYASAILASFQQDSEMDQSSVTGATVTLDGCDAYQVYGYYPDEDLFLVVWLLDSPEDDYIHYIAVEFTSDNYDLFEMVEDTYHVAY